MRQKNTARSTVRGILLIAFLLIAGCSTWRGGDETCGLHCQDSSASTVSGDQLGQVDRDSDGIGGTGIDPDGIGGTGLTGDGIGGTGLVADGIGGTGIIGPLEGFGSIIVNGLHIQLPDTLVILRNGRPSGVDTLQLGQMVEVLAQGEPLAAARIEVWDAVVGAVEQVDRAQGIVRILGQVVRLRGDTFVSLGSSSLDALKPGDLLRVSGLRRADGSIVATRVELAALDTPWMVYGPVTAVTPLGVQIGSLPVALTGVRPAELSVGRSIQVQGRMSGGLFQAERVQIRPEMPLVDQVDRLVIQGYALLAPASGAVRINGIALDSVQSPSIASDLVSAGRENRRIQITARVTRRGQLRVERMIVMPLDSSALSSGSVENETAGVTPAADPGPASSDLSGDPGAPIELPKVDGDRQPTETRLRSTAADQPNTGDMTLPPEVLLPVEPPATILPSLRAGRSKSSGPPAVPPTVGRPSDKLERPPGASTPRPGNPGSERPERIERPVRPGAVVPQRPIPIERPMIPERPVTLQRPTLLQRPSLISRPALPPRPAPVERPAPVVRPVVPARPPQIVRPTSPVRPQLPTTLDIVR